MIQMFKKKILPIIIFILLLTGLAYFPYIPLKLFNIDINRFSKSMTILYNFLCDIGYMIILFFLYKETLINDFKKFKKNYKDEFDLAFKYYFLGLTIMIISNLIISIFFRSANANNEEAIRSLIKLYPYYMFFSVSLYAPATEELIFRKSIKDCIFAYKKNKFTKYLYIIISGGIFALLHVITMITSPLDFLYIIPYLALGISFAALYVKSDNIFSSMIMHSMHNTIAILLYLMIGV